MSLMEWTADDFKRAAADCDLLKEMLTQFGKTISESGDPSVKIEGKLLKDRLQYCVDRAIELKPVFEKMERRTAATKAAEKQGRDEHAKRPKRTG